MTPAAWLALAACLLSAAALIVSVRAFRTAEYSARVARGTRAAKLNLGPSRRALEGRLLGPEPAEPAPEPAQPAGHRSDTREMRLPRPGEL